MKRKKLLCKSIALGLAVAMAATTMSVPGGVLNPTAVYAEDAEVKDLPESESPLLYNGSETLKVKYNEDLVISAKEGWTVRRGYEDEDEFASSVTFQAPEDNASDENVTLYLKKGDNLYKKTIHLQFDTRPVTFTITQEEAETSEANVSLKFSSNKMNTTTYYVCSKNEIPDITADKIKQHEDVTKKQSSLIFFFENLMLDDNTTYYIYAVQEDEAGNISDVVKSQFTTVKRNDTTGKILLTSQNYNEYFDYAPYRIVSEEELAKGVFPIFSAKDGSCNSQNGFKIKYMDQGAEKTIYNDTVKKTGYYDVRIKPTDDNPKFYSDFSEVWAQIWFVYLPMPENLVKVVYYDANNNVVNCMKQGGRAVISADGYTATEGGCDYDYKESAVIGDNSTAQGEGTFNVLIAFQKDGVDYATLVPLSYVEQQKPASIVAVPTLGNLNEETHTLAFTGQEGAAYEYSLDGGKTWMDVVLDGTNGSISLGNKSYAANAIQIRAKETETNAAGVAVIYGTAIVAKLEGNVTLLDNDSVKKYGQIITAQVTGAQEGAALQYTFIRVKDSAETVAQTSEKPTYTIGKEDIGCTLKVKVTADGYDESKPLESVETSTVEKADGRTVETVTGYMQQVGESYTYTVTPVAGAEYRMNDGDWQKSNVFTDIKPGTQNVKFSAQIPEDDCYKAGEVKTSDPVNFAKLTREMPKLSYTVTDGEDGAKIVTIDPVEGAVYYQYDGKQIDNNVFTVPADQLEKVTIGIWLPETDIYQASRENKQMVNLTLETQTAPEAAVLTAKVNAAGTGYDITVTEPKAEEGVTYEYSNSPMDGFGTLEQLTGLTDVAPGTKVVIYVRKAAVEGKKNASPATECSIQTDLFQAAAPVISGPTSFTGTATVTMTAAGKIYYTTDGSTPTVDSTLYTGAITIDKTTTIKAIAVENGKPVSDVTSLTLTKTSSGSGSSGSGSSGSAAGADTPAVKPETKTETTTETKPDGTVVTTTTTTAEDGTQNVVVELKNVENNSFATVTVSKDASGKTLKAEAAVEQVAKKNTLSVSGALIAQITEAAGTKNVNVVTSVKDSNGAKIGTITVNAEKLVAGKKLAVVKVNPKTGEKTLVNAKSYKVTKDGSISVSGLKNAEYELITTTEKTDLSKKIAKTVTAKNAKKTVKNGAKTTFAFGTGLNKENVKSVKYVSSKKSVAAVDKNGKIKAKKAGKTIVKAVVTLKDGTKKTVKTEITVKSK